jgi:nucleoside-diphosphate-sugar epimerase
MVQGNKALVTGAGGFIGSHLTEALLASGRKVRALDLDFDRLQHLAGAPDLELLRADIADAARLREALSDVNTVFHLAAAHLGASTPEAEFERVNIDAVRALTHLATRAGVDRFIHCSSVGVFGRIENPPADESSACRPELPYERTKLAGESVVLESVANDGLRAVVLRPVWVYGSRCGRTEKLFRTIARGRFLIAGRGETLRHSIYIRDMIEAFLLAEDSEAALGQVIIVGAAEPTTIRGLVDRIAAITGAAPPRSVPFGLLQAVAVAAEAVCLPLGKEPPISRRSLRFFTGNTAFSIERSRRLLGFEPRYDLTGGLTETYRLLGGSARGSGQEPGPPP